MFYSHSRFLPSTPTGHYAQRKNSGNVICSLNEGVDWRGKWQQEVKVSHYDTDRALTAPYHHMFQKTSDKAQGIYTPLTTIYCMAVSVSVCVCVCVCVCLVLLEHAEQLGEAICHHHSLPEPLPVSQPSLVRPHPHTLTPPPPPHTLTPSHPHILPPSHPPPTSQEPAVFVGRVVCDGEGHLNASSCLLEGPVRPRAIHSHRVRLELPPSLSCSLFPGQVGVATHVTSHTH